MHVCVKIKLRPRRVCVRLSDWGQWSGLPETLPHARSTVGGYSINVGISPGWGRKLESEVVVYARISTEDDDTYTDVY